MNQFDGVRWSSVSVQAFNATFRRWNIAVSWSPAGLSGLRLESPHFAGKPDRLPRRYFDAAQLERSNWVAEDFELRLALPRQDLREAIATLTDVLDRDHRLATLKPAEGLARPSLPRGRYWQRDLLAPCCGRTERDVDAQPRQLGPRLSRALEAEQLVKQVFFGRIGPSGLQRVPRELQRGGDMKRLGVLTTERLDVRFAGPFRPLQIERLRDRFDADLWKPALA